MSGDSKTPPAPVPNVADLLTEEESDRESNTGENRFHELPIIRDNDDWSPWPNFERALFWSDGWTNRNRPTLKRVVDEAVGDIRNNVRRNLNLQYDSETSVPESNIETQRKIPFGELDLSLFSRAPGQHAPRNTMTSPRENQNATRWSDEITNAAVDGEINRLRAQINGQGEQTDGASFQPRRESDASVNETLLGIITQMRHQMCHLTEQMHALATGRPSVTNSPRDPLNVTYGRTLNDVRNRQSRAANYLQLKEARGMIPEFDGTSQSRLQEFLNACTYAINNINPAEEAVLLEAILCTKLKGKAMIDFENRDIQNFEQLKRNLESCYSTKRSTVHLQVEFNSLRQRPGESAQTYGLRADKLAMQLYESLVDDKYTSDQKRAILETVQQQALQNYQLGLQDDIKLMVRSQHHQTLYDAITCANAEERFRSTHARSFVRTKPNTYTRDIKPLQCYKCGKLGHHGQECRTNRYVNKTNLPRQSEISRVNTAEKYCTHCKKTGHNRDECWFLHGKPSQCKNSSPRQTTGNNMQTNTYQTFKNRVENTSSTSNGTDHESGNNNNNNNGKAMPARNFRVNQITIKKLPEKGLELITLPVQETKNEKLALLYDTGSAISFIKLRNVKDDVMITEERLVLTGITGHAAYTIGKFNSTIKIGKQDLIHCMYVVRDEFPIDYEGILGIDFLHAYEARCDYRTHQVELCGNIFKLQPHQPIKLQPRSETIVAATVNKNQVGLVVAKEIQPGVIIGNCIVEPEGHTCKINIINTSENTVEIGIPHVTVDEFDDATNADETYFDINTITINRTEQLKELVRTQHLNTEEKSTIMEICEEFNDIFHLEGDSLTNTTAVKHEINTKADSAPVNIKPYRLPQKHHEEINKQIKEMVKNKIIRPSRSQWNAPLLVVPKKADASGNIKLRIVIDFRKLNDLTIGDSFPLPNITDILDQLGNAKYFTTLDLAAGYHQIPMAEKDKQKTAFSSSTGHYEYNRMPFGLKNAPATFQRLMNTILTGLQGIECLVYLDDIVLYGTTLQEHNKRLINVFMRLREYNLKLQPDKCEFLRKEVNYLGHIISENGILPDPNKLTAVKNFPTPKNVKDIQSFIGLAGYYRRFIENFSKIAKPMTKLTKKGQPFQWNIEQQNAFVILKDRLTSAPVLNFPDFTREFIVTTDASDYAIGAILSQGEVGQDRPVAYASRILSRAEQNYNTTEKELLAIVWAVKHFRPYVYGTKFKIVTDHKPLVWLFNVTDPGSRLIRWRLKLEEYDYVIVHKAGKTNINADALSRNVGLTITDTDKNDEKEKNRSNIKIDYTEDEKKQILYEYHDAPVGGHQGIERTLNRIKLKYNWKGLEKDVKNYIAKCEKCQKNKLKTQRKLPLIITDTPDKPFEKCALDIVGPLPVTSNGNKYLLTFQDNLTKFSKAIPISNQEATTIAKEFVTKIILEYGTPAKVLTDQGTNFLSNVFKNVCKILKIEKIQTTAYHPQSNGALERSHRTIAEYLRHYINTDQTDWDEWIPYAMFTYNTTPHTSTKYTPFELIYGHQAEIPTVLTQPPKPTYTIDDYAVEMKERLRATNQIAKENVKKEKEKSKQHYDKNTTPNTFRVGDKVLLYDETVRRGRSKKLDALWIGPYEIIKKNSEVNYTLKKGRKNFITHANRLKLFIEH